MPRLDLRYEPPPRLRFLDAKNAPYFFKGLTPYQLKGIEDTLEREPDRNVDKREPSQGFFFAIEEAGLATDGSALFSIKVVDLDPDGDGIVFVSLIFRQYEHCLVSVSGQREVGATVLRIPMRFLRKGQPRFEGKYAVYAHNLDGPHELDDQSYIGVTKRGWQKRWREHQLAARNGSNYLIHQAIRSGYGRMSTHTLMAAGLTKEQAMDVEEHYVAKLSLYPRGLNMIPGGNAGIRYLHKLGASVPRNYTSEDAHKVLAEYERKCLRERKPNLLLAARLQSDDDLITRIVCGRDTTFDLEEVRGIRYLHSLGYSHDAIIDELGIEGDNLHDRIDRLLAGQTYSRIH